MAKIITEYVVDATQAFRVADEVESRYANLDKSTSAALAGSAEVPKEAFASIDKLSKNVTTVRQQFEAISKTRLDSGIANNLTKEIVIAQERSRQLGVDILSLKRELANPLRKSSIGFLTDELRGAELEADSLARKLQTVQNRAGGAEQAATGGGGHGGLAGAQRFRGFGAAFRVASSATGLPITEAEAGIGVSALEAAGISTAFLAATATVAAFGVAAVLVSKSLREEAEKRLKTEESIAATVNKQIIDGTELLTKYKEQRAELQAQKDLSDKLKQSSTDALKESRDTLQRLFNATNNIEGQKKVDLQKEIDAINDQIKSREASSTAAQDKSFDQRNEDFKKTQADIRANVEKAKQEVANLGKQYIDTLDQVERLNGQDNPFIAIFLDADKAMETLKKNIAGLPDDVQKAFIKAEQNATNTKLFQARLDSRLSAFDLQDQARTLRDSSVSDRQRQDTAFNNFMSKFDPNTQNLAAFTRYTNYFQGASAANRVGLFDKQRQQEEATGLFRNPAYQKEIRDSLAKEVKDNTVQAKLDKQLEIINKLNPSTAEEKAAADRKVIAITAGLKPEDLTRTEIEAAAGAREREAARQLQEEAQGKKRDEERNKLLGEINENQKKLLKQAEDGGTNAVNNALHITVKDETGAGIETKTSKPTPEDTAATYDPDFLTSGSGGLSNR